MFEYFFKNEFQKRVGGFYQVFKPGETFETMRPQAERFIFFESMEI